MSRGAKNMNPFHLPGKVLALQLLTVSRLLFAAAFTVVLVSMERSPTILLVCLALLALGELGDLFDGIIARRFGLVSEFGAMLDPYMDSMSRLLVYWGLASAGLVLPFVPLVMALRDVTVAHCRIILTHRGRSVAAKWSGKIKAQVQVVCSILAILGPFYWDSTGTWTVTAISWLVIVATVGSIFEYAAGAIESVRRGR